MRTDFRLPHLFPCSRCGKPTRCNDLIGSNGNGRDFCAACLHAETIQQLDKTHDYFTDNDLRGERTSPDSDLVADSNDCW